MRILRWFHPWKMFVSLCLLLIFGVAVYHGQSPLKARLPAEAASNLNVDNIKDFKRDVIGSLLVHQISNSETEFLFRLPVELCQKFEDIELQFEAEGVSFAGDPIVISKKKKCYEIDPESLDIGWTLKAEDKPALVTADVEAWNLKAMIFHPKTKNETERIQISGYEFISVLSKPVAVSFH